MWLAMIAFQAATIAGPADPAKPRSARVATADSRCGQPDEDGDIVVCGQTDDAYRLKRLDPDRYVQRVPRAETEIGGGTRLSVEAEQGALPNGQTSPRAMMRITMPF